MYALTPKTCMSWIPPQAVGLVEQGLRHTEVESRPGSVGRRQGQSAPGTGRGLLGGLPGAEAMDTRM